MTPEQQKDAERLDRYIIREGLVSVMNHTKWREAIQVLQDVMGYSVRFRLKVVRGSEPPIDYWDGSFPNHVGETYKGIEWMEVNTLVRLWEAGAYTGKVDDHSLRLAAALDAKNIPFHLAEGIIRIQGYTRPGKPAD